LRVFLDTNVLVSAFATRGLCADVFELVLLNHELIASRTALKELERALREKLKLPSRNLAAILGFITGQAVHLVESSQPASAAVDADDAMVLGDAVGGGAQVFVTGDAKVLALGYHGELRIVSPRAFWEMLQAAGSR
jgi:putative PIN family toxin of toxin-antitoxin system